ncbi:mitochondrial carrier protein mtm1 [Phtheirospermum japonicum]|uniref:Mitochondrial carrier protein mtm1 n=1 Tax=Phtheirospermum japonicum TaxID=374723 RepID=A0A830BH85_9LAMI|nr:mitochondrial carrier protein mtm1 [Phtheirospermum japonicum]
MGIYMPPYNILRNHSEDITSHDALSITPYVPLVGSLAGSIACVSCYPIELARTRMQGFDDEDDQPDVAVKHGGEILAGRFQTFVIELSLDCRFPSKACSRKSIAIVAAEEELALHKKSNAEPVLEEFIPLKKSCKDEQIDRVEVDSTKKDISCRDKMNWMSSVQLWNSDSDLNYKLTLKLDNNKKRAAAEEVKQPAKDNVFQSIKNRTVVPLKGWIMRNLNYV